MSSPNSLFTVKSRGAKFTTNQQQENRLPIGPNSAPSIDPGAGGLIFCAPQVSHTEGSFRKDSHCRKAAGNRPPPASKANLDLQVALCL